MLTFLSRVLYTNLETMPNAHLYFVPKFHLQLSAINAAHYIQSFSEKCITSLEIRSCIDSEFSCMKINWKVVQQIWSHTLNNLDRLIAKGNQFKWFIICVAWTLVLTGQSQHWKEMPHLYIFIGLILYSTTCLVRSKNQHFFTNPISWDSPGQLQHPMK